MRQIYFASTLLAFSVVLPARAQAPSAPPFQFTAIDEKLLADTNELDQQLEKKGLVYHDPQVETYLARVAQQLLGEAPPPEKVAFKFRVARDPMVNAFALPNGSIYVNSGLLAVMTDEAELASILAHEITHVTNRHTYLQNRNLRKKVVTLNVISLVGAAGGYFPYGSVFGIALRSAAAASEVLLVATIFGYSQEMEREADSAGFNRMVQANYDGEAMVHAFEHLDEKLEFEPVEPFWRTHPKLQDRIAMAKAMARVERAGKPREVNETEYLAAVAPVIRYNSIADLDSRRARTAIARMQRLINWEPGNATDQTLLADGYRSLSAKPPHPDTEELSDRGQSLDRKRMLKLTADEEQQQLLRTPQGKAALENNRAKAESLYRETISQTPEFPDAHRGLGMLYQEQARYPEAAREYREYLRLAPADAPDRLRIERRLESASGAASGGTETK